MPAELQLKAKTDQYRTDDRYWEVEVPQTAQAGDVELRCYPQAGKLQFVKLITNRDGSHRVGQIVTADWNALAASPEAVQLLQAVLDDAKRGPDDV